MHSSSTRDVVAALLARGLSHSEVSARTGVPRSTVSQWSRTSWAPRPAECPHCDVAPLDEASYAALLGFYLGDGCLSTAARYTAFRVSCDATWPGIIADVTRLMMAIRPRGKVFHVRASGAVVVLSNWKHWPCLFPQHGPGRKHERPIVLEPWQQEIVDAHAGPFLRGLFHSDGSRTANWATRTVGGEKRRYDYPRWEFSNRSEDIIGLCTRALDLAGIAWRRPSDRVVAVSRRDDVRRLDALIGAKG